MILDQAKNFAKATLTTGITSSATSITLTTGHGAKLPTVPFNATIWNSTDYPDPSDDPQVEVLRVTVKATDTLTVTRAQESTSAVAHNTAGKTYKLAAGATAKLINTDLPTVFTRYRAREYDARNYLIGDGTTDDTAALQALFTQIGTDAQNATIYFDDATYIIGGALQEGARRNSQLILPTVGITDLQYTIQLIGHSTVACSPSGYEAVELPRGTKIKSTLATATGTDPSVITGRGPVGGYLDETNYSHIEIENIIFQTVPNPNYSCLNFRRYTTVAIKNCIVAAGPHMNVVAAIQPTTTTSYGIILPQYNSGICQRLEGQVNIFGFYYGIRCGELMHAENLGLWWCYKGMEFPFSYHASLIDRLLVFWCPYGAEWTAAHPVEIQQWDNEHTMTGESAWYATLYDVYDPSNLGYGEIKWLTVRASFGRESVFLINGGANLLTRELGVPSMDEGETPPTGLFFDNFTDTNYVLLSAHMPDIGTGWTHFETGADEIYIYNNCAVGEVNAGAANAYVANATAADAIITAKVMFPIGGAATHHYDEIVFRYLDANNYWKLSRNNKATGNFEIVKKEGGADTTVQTTTLAFTEGVFDDLKVTLLGTSITCEVNATPLSTTSSFNLSAAKHGIRIYRATAGVACLDTFKIESNP